MSGPFREPKDRPTDGLTDRPTDEETMTSTADTQQVITGIGVSPGLVLAAESADGARTVRARIPVLIELGL